MRLLIVDDDANITTALARLHRNVADITTAASVAEALQLLATQSFDFVIADHHLGHHAPTGMDLFRTMRLEYPSIRRILMSGGIDLKCSQVVAHALLLKPFTTSELFAALRSNSDSDLVLGEGSAFLQLSDRGAQE